MLFSRKQPVIAFTLVAFALSFLTVPSAGSLGFTSARGPTAKAPPTKHRYRERTVLVGFRAGTTLQQQRAIGRAAGATEMRVIGAGTHVLHVPKGQVKTKISLLRKYPRVRYAEPDYVVHADLTPNDPDYSKLWGLSKIDSAPAWDVTPGSRNIVVGVVDTGIDYTHPDLTANVWTNNGSAGHCKAGTHGYNAIDKSCDPMDDNKHGTHVSGTIGAVGNNGIGVVGVNENVSIMGLKFLSAAGSGYTSDAVTAIDWAVKAKQAGVNLRVLSNSWGGGGFSQALADEIAKAGANDILFVAAAGNNYSSNDVWPTYPCSYKAANEVCVAATDKTDKRASFSNYGANSVDLAAPGVDILSTVPGGGYASFSGTSMATPHVAGAAALVLSLGYQPVATLKSTILNSVDPVASLAGVVRTGGRLDVCKAVPGCGAPIAPGFSLAVSPSSQAITRGETTSYTVTLTSTGGFSAPIALSVSGLPDGATASFSTATLSGTATSTLSVSTSTTTPPGNFTLTVAGGSGGLTNSDTARLQIKRN